MTGQGSSFIIRRHALSEVPPSRRKINRADGDRRQAVKDQLRPGKDGFGKLRVHRQAQYSSSPPAQGRPGGFSTRCASGLWPAPRSWFDCGLDSGLAGPRKGGRDSSRRGRREKSWMSNVYKSTDLVMQGSYWARPTLPRSVCLLAEAGPPTSRCGGPARASPRRLSGGHSQRQVAGAATTATRRVHSSDPALSRREDEIHSRQERQCAR